MARKIITDWDAYNEELRKRLGLDDAIMRAVTTKAKMDPKRVVFAEADNYKILKAAQIVKDENIAIPILLGNKEKIQAIIDEHALELVGVEIIDQMQNPEKTQQYAEALFKNANARAFLRCAMRQNY